MIAKQLRRLLTDKKKAQYCRTIPPGQSIPILQRANEKHTRSRLRSGQRLMSEELFEHVSKDWICRGWNVQDLTVWVVRRHFHPPIISFLTIELLARYA